MKPWIKAGVLWMCFWLGAPAWAQRHALVVGNDSYAGNTVAAKEQGHWGILRNARNDARDIGQELQRLGFVVEKVHQDLGRAALMNEIIRFAERSKNAEVALVYYSGHGAQIDGRNHLIPVDAGPITSLSEVETGAVSLDWVLDKLPGSAKLKVVWLDACRDTPVVSRSGAKGLANLVAQRPDTVISFAAAANKLAYDGVAGQRNGWFAQGLLKGLRSEQPNLFGVVAEAAREVKRLSQNRQTPMTYGSNDLQEDFWFAKPTPKVPSPVIDTTKDAQIAELKKQLAEQGKTPAPPAPTPWPADAIARHPETGAPLKAKEVVAHAQGLGPKMVVLPKAPAQGYLMGSPSTEADRSSDEKQHRVTIPYVLAMSQTHVTFDDWTACVQGGGCKGKPKPQANFGAGKMPVINVSHHDAREYVAWLNKTVGLQAGSANWAYRYRLPSEIETEYAARAGTTTPFYTGENITTAQANYDGNYPYKNNAKGQYRQRTTEVGSLLAPNEWGLHDMAGNVYGWQADCYEADYDKVGDLKGKAYRDADEDSGACANRSARGGSWSVDAQYLRSASRFSLTPSIAFYDVGFRLTRMLPSGS